MDSSGLSARARLIKTRKGTWVDESLFPEARRECLAILERVALESQHDGIVEMLRGERKHLDGTILGDRHRMTQARRANYYWPSRWSLNFDAIQLLRDRLSEFDVAEEEEARELAFLGSLEVVDRCGCCGRRLDPGESVHFGAKVYVGFPPLGYKSGELRPCQPDYRRTVLCGSCAPGWLSVGEEGVVMQLCSHCDRPMVYLLTSTSMRRSFCSEPCRSAYHGRLRKERRAEEREKVCEVCGKEFIAARKDAKTCSSKCKQKDYRRRKRDAQQGR